MKEATVYNLVHQLRSGEKRFFSLRNSSYETNSQVLMLYTVLSKQKKYDKLAAEKHLSQKGKVYYSAIANKLTQLILDTLVDYNYTRLKSTNIEKLIAHATIFLQKNMNNHCFLTLKRFKNKKLK